MPDAVQATGAARLTDDELIAFLGLKPDDFTDPEHKQRFLASIAAKRPAYERMAGLTVELHLHEQGLAPRPPGVMLDWDRKARRA